MGDLLDRWRRSAEGLALYCEAHPGEKGARLNLAAAQKMVRKLERGEMDRADEIARETVAGMLGTEPARTEGPMVVEIAAALRAYANAMLDEIADGIGDDGHVDGAYLRSLKSQPIQEKP